MMVRVRLGLLIGNNYIIYIHLSGSKYESAEVVDRF